MKEYRVVNGTELIRGIFKDMKKTDLVKSAYSGQQILNILDKEFNGVIYEPGERKLIISGDENNSLIKRFYELISLNKIRLEPILKCR
ncbi:MAG: hypothetical protein KKF67_00480 [Nanoarchaeota archaeon]|nr:hypothetical protein [Nanoarchaeota archaeon]